MRWQPNSAPLPPLTAPLRTRPNRPGDDAHGAQSRGESAAGGDQAPGGLEGGRREGQKPERIDHQAATGIAAEDRRGQSRAKQSRGPRLRAFHREQPHVGRGQRRPGVRGLQDRSCHHRDGSRLRTLGTDPAAPRRSAHPAARWDSEHRFGPRPENRRRHCPRRVRRHLRRKHRHRPGSIRPGFRLRLAGPPKGACSSS